MRIWSFSGPHFPVFGLNTETYGVSLRIQSERGKIQTRKTPNTETFHAVVLTGFFWSEVVFLIIIILIPTARLLYSDSLI